MAVGPEVDLHSAAFWEGLGHRKVVVGRCLDCGRRFFPHLPGCPWCGGGRLATDTVPGSGTVYSWVRVHRPLSDAPVVEPPYVVAAVDLDGGCRIFGRIEPQEAAAVGLAVAAEFVDHDGWTELTFRPAR